MRGAETGATPTFNAAGLSGPATVTVTLRVTDADNASTTNTTTVVITNVAPTANARGPYTVAEGSTVALNGTGSDPIDTISFAWDLDGDGTFGETGAAASRGNETGAAPTLNAAGVSGPATGVLASILSPGGTLVSFAAMSEAPISMSPLDVIFKPITLRGFWMGHPEYAAKIPPALRQAAAMIASGLVHVPVSAVYPLSSIKEAVAHALRGGKILLDVAGSSA